MKKLLASLLPLFALLLDGCSSKLIVHQFPKTDSRGIPSYCSEIKSGIPSRWLVEYHEDSPTFSIADRGDFMYKTEPCPDSYNQCVYSQDNSKDKLPIHNYKAEFSAYTTYELSFNEAKVVCGIKEALENKKLSSSEAYWNIYMNTNEDFNPELFLSKAHTSFHTRAPYGGRAIYDNANNALMAKISLERKPGESLAFATERVYSEVLEQSSTMLNRVHNGFYETQIPPIPQRPNRPTETILAKDPYEKLEAFAKRVEATKIYEARMREYLADQHIKQLEAYNAKILSLREDYTKALEMQHKENQRVVDWLIKHQETILKTIANAIFKNEPYCTKFGCDDYTSYDADSEILRTKEFRITHPIYVKIKMSADEVRSLQNTSNWAFYDQKVDVEFKDGEMIIGKSYVRGEKTKWLEVIEDGGSSIPKKVEARIVVSPPKDNHTVKLLESKLAIIPPKSGVWDSSAAMKVADLYNPKVPQWFSTPNSKEKIAYGTGLSLDEAKNDALRELAIMHSANISVKQSTKTKVKGTPSAEVTSEKEVNVSTNKSYTGSYRIIKQEPMDGRWYVSIQEEK